MIPPSFFKDKDSLDILKQNLNRRKTKLEYDFESIALKRRKCIISLEEKQSQRNRLSKKIGELKAKDAIDEEMSKIKEEVTQISIDLKNLKKQQEDVEKEYQEMILCVPNLLDESVPEGKDETENQIIKQEGKIPEFNFNVLPHHEVSVKNDLIDFERSARMSGSRFYIYNSKIAALERNLTQFMLEEHQKSGYEEKLVPLLVKNECMTATGQFPKFRDEYYHIPSDGLNLIPTAEVPLTNLYANEILPQERLPIYLMACTPCFRREAGSSGKDTKGIIRVHQFQKVELVKICLPQESSIELEKLLANAESILEKLCLTYRIILLCSGDTGFSASKTYDLEVWMPGSKRWLEVSSCSNFKDFQARRAKIRYKENTGKNEIVHTLNGSGVAAGRLIAALLEYHQTPEGSINWKSLNASLEKAKKS